MGLGNATHWKGPLLGSDQAGAGLYEDVSADIFSYTQSNWVVCIDDFWYDIADIATMETLGWTETAVGTAASRTNIVNKEARYLLINGDTVADEGSSLQANAAVSAAATGPAFKSIGPLTSTTTLMDGQGILFEARINLLNAVGTFNSKFVIGWAVTDTAMMTASTGAVALATGGGIIFHAGEDGNLMFGTQSTSTYAEVDTGVDIATSTSFANANWLRLGFKAVWIDASASTGYVHYYVNGIRKGTIVNALPMTSTETYSVSIELVNGPATANQVDMAVDYIVTGITRPGVTQIT